jgi:hypothetical protein
MNLRSFDVAPQGRRDEKRTAILLGKTGGSGKNALMDDIRYVHPTPPAPLWHVYPPFVNEKSAREGD